MRTVLGILTLVGALIAPPATNAQTVRFKVVVNAQNPVSALPASEVSRIFMGRATRWPTGELIEPVDQTDGSAVRERFVSDIHHRDGAALSSYWQQQIFAGKDVPPPAMATDAEILAYVRQHPGAIGYIAAETPSDRVKVITVVND